MSAASFTVDRGIVHVTWTEPEPIEVTFDQIRSERRTAEVSAEVLFRTGVNGSSKLVHRTRLNLSSTRARLDVAKHVGARVRGFDWPTVMEEVCWKVIDVHRRGRPAIRLRDAADDPPGAQFVLPPLLVPGDPVILFGDGGTTKSYLDLALALSLHGGRPIVGNLKPVRPMKCAYLDWEWKPSPHKRRMRKLWTPGDDLPDLVYIPCAAEGPLVHQVDRLRAIFHAEQIQYAVLDSVALACDGPPEEASTALTFFGALSRLEVGSLLTAHINRGGDTMKPFGSAYWHDSARATWYVDRIQEDDSDELDLALFNRKANDEKRVAPLGLHFTFSVDRTVITRTDVADVPDLAAKLPLKARIVAALRAGPLTYVELAERLGVTVDVVRMTVKRHVGKTFTIVTENPDRVHRVALLAHAEQGTER